MSQTAAIAATTLALKALLEASLKVRGIEDRHLADVLVTTMPVDRARGVHHRCQLNLSMTTAVESSSSRTAVGLGARAAGGGDTAAQALDLFYLLTAYGPEDDEVGAQRVLGAALRTLHEQPVLPPIRLDVVFPHSGATGTLEQLRVTQAPLTREHIIGCWLAFRTPYRLSCAIQVSGVALG